LSPRYESPYFTPEFSLIAGQFRPSGRIVVARDSNAEAVGFLPVQKDGLVLKLVRPLGAPFVDYNGPIIKAGHEGMVPSMLRAVGASIYSFTGTPILAELPEEQASSETEDDQALKVNISESDPEISQTGAIVRNQVRAYVADLSEGWDIYLESCRSKFPKHFKKARRLWRQAEREVGSMELQFHEPSEEAFATLIGWKRDQFERTGLHDVLGAAWSRDMLLECLRTQNEHFGGVLTTLRCDGKLMAAEFGIRSGRVLHGWISGYNDEFHSYSPGMLLQTRLLEAAAENGIEHADLGMGADHYKKYYANRVMPVSLGVIPANNVQGALRCIAGTVWDEVENASFLGPASKLAGKFRRRMDVILSVETKFSKRAEGIVRAIKGA
jgi:CelD/BcsL family acetyltransferase involved in cellulose biosynthesis